MPTVQIPYGHTFLSADINAANFAGCYTSKLPGAAADQSAEVCRALDNPIASPPLEELARGRKNAVVITSDHTRPVPSQIIMPQILRRLRKFAPDIKITILVATGAHRATTMDELIAKLGKDIVENEQIVIHDSTDATQLVEVGTLPSGGKLILNKLAMETELLVAEGFIEPHFFAGFSGGRKAVLPGIASRTTVLANHCSEFIQSEFARTGNLTDNPIHCDMLFAARQAKLAFIVNVVINEDKKIVKAFAGDREQAHLQGCEFLRSCCRIKVPEIDIVLTSNGGYPLDQNIYQAVKGMTTGEAVCRKNGVIIMCASCSDGHGGESFRQHLAEAESPAKLLAQIAGVPRNATIPDQWQYQILCRILKDFTVIVVTKDCSHELLKSMHMQAANSITEALQMAYKITGNSAKVAVIPDGVAVIAQKIS